MNLMTKDKNIICDKDTYKELLRIFGPEQVKNLIIEEPYLSAYQKYNLVKLLEELKNDRKKLEKD